MDEISDEDLAKMVLFRPIGEKMRILNRNRKEKKPREKRQHPPKQGDI